MPLTFDQLWEKCEALHQETNVGLGTQQILEELMLKINLYKAIDNQNEIPLEDRQKIKSRTMGEILFTLTNLSLKDNINVYEALNIILQYRSADHYSKKYPM